jgi:2-oxoisovalerate dehydrogenase E1 component
LGSHVFPIRKGFGGPFHNGNLRAVPRDSQGAIIVYLSDGCEAVRMSRDAVRQALEEQRVVVMIELIA